MAETREIALNLPTTIEITVDGGLYKIETAKWSEEFLLDQITQGVKIRLQRAGAGKDNKDAARAQVVANLNAGEISRKAADPQAAAIKAIGKLTPEQQAELIAMLQQAQAQ